MDMAGFKETLEPYLWVIDRFINYADEQIEEMEKEHIKSLEK